MRPARLSPVLALFALAAAGLHTTPAHAGYFMCNSRTMTSNDYFAMKRAATHAAAGHVLNWSDVTPCMNPGRGRVWVAAKPEPQADGSRINLAAVCTREKGPWKCDLESRRRYEFSLPLGGREQKFEVVIPMHYAVSDVKAFVARVLERAATLTAREYCAVMPEEHLGEWGPRVEQGLRELLKPRDEPFRGWLTEDGEHTSLSIDDSVSFDYSRSPDAVAEKSFECWADVVVVT